MLPNQTFVLIGYCKSKAHLDWICKMLFYNFRTDNNRGALKLNHETINAKYLLLHMKGDKSSSRLYKIPKSEYRVTPKATLSRLHYPEPGHESYLVVKLEPCSDREFESMSWDFRKLNNYRSGIASAIPFTASLSELVGVKYINLSKSI